MTMKFNTIPEILSDIKLGKIVIMLDDHDRENEGDFVMAADFVTPESINFMALYGRGLICTPISRELAERLSLTPMVDKNSATHETAFTVTIDAKENISTGISSSDRSHTIKLMLEKNATEKDFARPGHIFPLIAKDGGVVKRRGHTEAAVDLATLCGLNPAGVICEILKEDGNLAKGSELFEIANRFNLKIGTIADLVDYINSTLDVNNVQVEKISTAKFPNKYGNDFKLSVYRNNSTGEELSAIILGENFDSTESVLVRLHSECFTGDVFGSSRCDCGDQLKGAMEEIAKRGKGILLYLKQEGRGIGLSEKIKSYELQEMGFDTIEANIKLGHPVDSRNYDFACDVLKSLNVKTVELLSNNPDKKVALEKNGFIVSMLNLKSEINPYNQFYLQTKKEKMGHFIQ